MINIRNAIKKFKIKLYPNNIINRMIFRLGCTKGELGRDKQDSEVLDYYRNSSSEKPSVSAVYRVKNGQEYIELAILSIVPLVKEIVFIDNGSTDLTLSIVNKLKDSLKGQVDIKIFQYHQKTALAGEGYADRVRDDPASSLAEFYKFAFSKGSEKYLVKCDAHYIFTPAGIEKIKASLSNYSPDVLFYSGMEIFGKSMGLEPFLFRASSNYDFIDDLLYEKLVFKGKLKTQVIRMPVFLHVKRLSYAKFFHVSQERTAVQNKYETQS